MGTTQLTASNWNGTPRRYSADGSRTAALFLGGVGCDRTCTFRPDSPYGAFSYALLAAGLPVFSTNVLAHTWANDSAMSAISSLRTLAGSSPYNAKISKVLLIGTSQGSLNALNWAMRNPTLVAAVACLLPIPNLVQMHDSPGTPSYASDIETAYGLGSGSVASNVTIAAHDPNQNLSSFADIPIKFWYANDDLTASPASAMAFASALNIPAVDMGAIGHTTDSARAPDVAAWLAQYA